MDPVVCLLFMTANIRITRTILNQVPGIWFLSRHFTGSASCTSSAPRHFTTLYCNSRLRNTFPFSPPSTRQVTKETSMMFSKLYQLPADLLDQPLVAQFVNNYPTFYGTRTLVIVFTPVHSWYPALNQQESSLHQPRIYFNILVYFNPVTYSVLNYSK